LEAEKCGKDTLVSAFLEKLIHGPPVETSMFNNYDRGISPGLTPSNG
jgi:hypothetical protein